MPYKRHYLAAALTISVTVFTLGSTVVSASPQSILRFELAGVDVRDGLSFVKCDAKAGYYLSARTDGFSRSYSLTMLTLSPNRTCDTLMDFTPVKAATLPRLRSGKGVNLGDDPPMVEQKLGALPTTTGYDRRSRQLTYTYETAFKLTRGTMTHKRMDYRSTYVFHNGRLWSVEYKMQEPQPGFGNTNASL